LEGDKVEEPPRPLGTPPKTGGEFFRGQNGHFNLIIGEFNN